MKPKFGPVRACVRICKSDTSQARKPTPLEPCEPVVDNSADQENDDLKMTPPFPVGER